MGDIETRLNEEKHPSKFVVLILLLMGAFGVMGGGLVAPGLPTIGAAFNAPEHQFGLILSIYTLAAAISLPVIGYFIDTVGRKKVGLTCLLIDGITGLTIILSPSFHVLLLLRFIQGIGIAGLVPVGMTIIGDLFSGDKRLQTIGFLSAGIAIAAVIIPLIGGALAALNWKYVFLVYGFSLILAILFYFIIPETKQNKRSENATSFISISDKQSESMNVPSQLINQNVEKTTHSSLKKYLSSLLEALKIKDIRNIIFHSFVLYFLLYGLISYSSTYLMKTHGFDEIFNGIAIAVHALFAALLASRAVIISKYLNWRKRAFLGYIIISLSFLLLPIWPKGSVFVAFSFICYGMGMGIVSPTIYNRVTKLSPPEISGAVIAIFNTMKYLGMTMAPIFIGIILLFSTLDVVFMLMGMICALWAILTII